MSRIVIRGTVRDSGSSPAPGAVVEVAGMGPLLGLGVTVAADLSGRYLAELSSAGIGTVAGDIRMLASVPNQLSGRVDLSGVRLMQDHPWGAEPDTIIVDFRLGPHSTPAAAQAVRLKTVLELIVSGIEMRAYRLITEEPAWRIWWASAHAQGQQTDSDAPPVDFRTHSILIAEGGRRGSQGFSFAIEQAYFEGGKLYITKVERSPCLTLPAESTPVHAVLVPHSEIIASITEVTERRGCRSGA